MAEIYRTNGNVGAVGYGTSFLSTAVGASFIGKNLLALGVRVVGAAGPANLQAEAGVNGAVAGILRSVSANTTVLAYQLEPGTTGNLSLLLEGATHLTATDIQNTIKGGGNGAGWYGNTNNIDASSSLVTNYGFKLSTVSTGS
jgi:hypothetical protein